MAKVIKFQFNVTKRHTIMAFIIIKQVQIIRFLNKLIILPDTILSKI